MVPGVRERKEVGGGGSERDGRVRIPPAYIRPVVRGCLMSGFGRVPGKSGRVPENCPLASRPELAVPSCS